MMRVLAAAAIGAVILVACQGGHSDTETLDALVEFARAPGEETWSELPLADRVQLGLGDRLWERRSAAALRDPAEWELDVELFRGGVGPFSALDVLADDDALEYRKGSYERCASPPAEPPPHVAKLRRLSIQPDETESCLQWFAVDVFVSEEGEIAAVTLDLWEP
jgi:hypothetical protein